MQSIDVGLNGRSYPVLVGPGILREPATWRMLARETPLMVVTNEVVAPLYLEALETALGRPGLPRLVLPDGESAKDRKTWLRIIDTLAGLGAGRDTCLLALGGGVTGDLCGFAAATWMRGIDYVQIPTTLLAQVDAAVGGKTAINIPAGKNLVGAFHQPLAVIADTDTLATLPAREYRAGLAEVVKYGAIMDAEFLARLESSVASLLAGEPELLTEVVITSVRHKADIVARDEREAGPRATLNFGHTFAHALEALTGYRRFLHGEAVAIGMVAAARLSELRGLCAPGAASRLKELLEALHLPVAIPPNIASGEILETMRLDKKNRGGRRRLILLDALGSAIIDESSPDTLIHEALELCR